MKKQSISLLAALSLATAMPAPASADLKDALLGAAAGALITHGVHQQRQQNQQRSAPRAAAPSAPSLNSQYSRAERVQIQQSLAQLGYPVGTIDGILGKNSRRMIRQYQASIGAAATGQLTPLQFTKLTNPAGQFAAAPGFQNRPLNPQEVALLQQSLMVLGFYRGGIDGVSGPGTRAATNNFLASYGHNPAVMTQVQTVVLAANTARIPAPPQLVQEASLQSGAGQQQPFGGQPQQPFGTPAPQQAFGQPNQVPQQQFQQQGQQPFQQQQPQFQQQGQQPTTALFNQGQAPAGQAPQQQQQLFQQQPQQAAPGGQQQQLFQQQQQQQVAPNGGQVLQASGTPAGQGVQQPAAQPQSTLPAAQPQSTLDVFKPVAETPAPAPAAPAPTAQQPAGTPKPLFADPNATVAQGGEAPAANGAQPLFQQVPATNN